MHPALIVLLLALLQGITEFLPISSSGHLVLAEHWLSFERLDSVILEVLLHFATLGAIIIFFSSRIKQLLGYLMERVRPHGHSKTSSPPTSEVDVRARMLLLILIGSIPTALIGILGKDFFSSLFNSPHTVSFALLITAILLFLTFARQARYHQWQEFPYQLAFLIGIAQGIAITPGISRSGATIACGIIFGLQPALAFEFSFLLSIPALIGAMLISLKDLGGLHQLGVLVCLLGFLVSLVSGFVCLHLLHRVITRGRFYWFGFYCLALGIVALPLFSR